MIGAGMETVAEIAERLLGLSEKPEALTFAQVAVRAFLVYCVLIAFVRFGKKRFLAQATAFDAILIILIGSVASRAVSGTAPFFASLLAVGWLIALHSIFSFISCRSDRFSHLIKGNPTVVIRDGRVDRNALRKAHMSNGDLEEDLRKQGLGDAAEVSEGRVERDGTLSVLKSAGRR
jgi:uncharacterized membrane protein YcaP (DUF421 family)